MKTECKHIQGELDAADDRGDLGEGESRRVLSANEECPMDDADEALTIDVQVKSPKPHAERIIHEWASMRGNVLNVRQRKGAKDEVRDNDRED